MKNEYSPKTEKIKVKTQVPVNKHDIGLEKCTKYDKGEKLLFLNSSYIKEIRIDDLSVVLYIFIM